MQDIMFPCHRLKDITGIYSQNNQPRYQHLISTFQSAYHRKPQFIGRAPGRVNIIGQHIDYEGYGVLPAAIEKDCLIAVALHTQPTITVNHVNPTLYPPQTYSTDPQAKVQLINNYHKYFRAGYGAGVKGVEIESLKGMQIMMSGNILTASGLSSSSALCVCSALVAYYANYERAKQSNKDIKQFIERVIVGERETGTACGGMDQSISVMGRQGSCLYIQFDPIRSQKVNLPQDCKFVIMNSLVTSAKLQTVVHRYNKRVCECRLAVRMLGKCLGMEGEPRILREVELWSGLSLDMLSRLVKQYIPRHNYTAQQLQKLLGQPLSQVLADIQLSAQVIKANQYFKPYQAAKHVFEEAYRVLQFVKVCKSKLSNESKMKMLGRLMNESQKSCAQLYQCSCPEIDEITVMALKRGALGSRLTGAGWGGCTVSLVRASECNKFMEAMKSDYYQKRPELEQVIKQFGMQAVVFESQPSEGACIITL